ncbi:hypothetical protein, partial [Pararhodobacter marinus]|uniref:hypothetical protein n=1 Tax=Pararhodobacter marinus TaxID=2184063 RepID=UPI00143CD4DF
QGHVLGWFSRSADLLGAAEPVNQIFPKTLIYPIIVAVLGTVIGGLILGGHWQRLERIEVGHSAVILDSDFIREAGASLIAQWPNYDSEDPNSNSLDEYTLPEYARHLGYDLHCTTIYNRESDHAIEVNVEFLAALYRRLIVGGDSVPISDDGLSTMRLRPGQSGVACSVVNSSYRSFANPAALVSISGRYLPQSEFSEVESGDPYIIVLLDRVGFFWWLAFLCGIVGFVLLIGIVGVEVIFFLSPKMKARFLARYLTPKDAAQNFIASQKRMGIDADWAKNYQSELEKFSDNSTSPEGT